MEAFEWDEDKQQTNFDKHGIDFADVIPLFDDPDRIETETIRKNEKRYQTIGLLHGVVVFVVYTHRSCKRRLISARPANRQERAYYETVKQANKA